MTQNDIKHGPMMYVIAIASAKPGEFVAFCIDLDSDLSS